MYIVFYMVYASFTFSRGMTYNMLFTSLCQFSQDVYWRKACIFSFQKYRVAQCSFISFS